jgi:hypothetical protein
MLLYHKHLNYQGRFEILIVMIITVMFFWNVTSSSLVNNYRYLEWISYLHIQGRRVNNIGKSSTYTGENILGLNTIFVSKKENKKVMTVY